MTNFEKIKNMDINEMIKFIEDLCDCDFCAYDYYTCSGEDCRYGIEKWLEREVESDD